MLFYGTKIRFTRGVVYGKSRKDFSDGKFVGSTTINRIKKQLVSNVSSWKYFSEREMGRW
jgi:hypothetical protein